MKKSSVTRLFSVLTAIVILLVSCGSSGGITVSPDAKAYPAAEAVMSALGETMFPGSTLLYAEAESEYDRIDPAAASMYLGSGTDDIDMTKIVDYAMSSPVYAAASQFGIIRAASAEDTAVIQTWLENRSVRVAGEFSSYLPEEEAIAKGWEVRIAGEFVYYAASGDNQTVFDVIEKALSAAAES